MNHAARGRPSTPVGEPVPSCTACTPAFCCAKYCLYTPRLLWFIEKRRRQRGLHCLRIAAYIHYNTRGHAWMRISLFFSPRHCRLPESVVYSSLPCLVSYLPIERIPQRHSIRLLLAFLLLVDLSFLSQTVRQTDVIKQTFFLFFFSNCHFHSWLVVLTHIGLLPVSCR